jgi:hypothetical protein
MKNITGAFGAQLDRIGGRDADRELFRAAQAKRRDKKAQHDNPPVWAFQGITNKKRDTK